MIKRTDRRIGLMRVPSYKSKLQFAEKQIAELESQTISLSSKVTTLKTALVEKEVKGGSI